MSLADYLGLGTRQSLLNTAQRELAHGLFQRYRTWLAETGLHDSNLVAYEWRTQMAQKQPPVYDFVVIDAVQDLTPVQLALVLALLKAPSQFILCGDSHQIVHPNLFSWAALKSLFWQGLAGDAAQRQQLKLLQANFRNTRAVTEVANRLLKIKQVRFGSVDGESNFLVRSTSAVAGEVRLLDAKEKTLAQSIRDAFLRHKPVGADRKQSHVRDLPCCFLQQQGNGVITMDMIGRIRRLHSRGKKSEREIARMTGLSRNTVAKWLHGEVVDAPKYRRSQMPSKLDAFEETIKQALKADARRPKHERRTARAIHAEIKAQGYEGGYSRVTDFIRAWRRGEGAGVAVRAFVPLSFDLGEAFQFDWSEEGLVVGGIYYRLQVAHIKLCASRAFWLVAYPSQGHEMLFDAHTRCFAALGGVARRGIYDNMRTAVDKVRKGKGRLVNARFAVMCGHYLFDPDFCNVASGWEKGVVEKNLQDSRRRIWIDATQQRFASFAELNAWIGQRCRALWDEVRHPEHDQFSVAEMLEHERPHLMPMPAPFDGYVEQPARVSSTCLVAVARNRYSVPCEVAGQMVSTRLYPTTVVVVAGDQVVASHERLSNRGDTRYDWQHYIPLIQRKPGALRNGAPFADLPVPL